MALVCIEVSGDGKGGHLAARAVTQNAAGFIDPNAILVLKEMRRPKPRWAIDHDKGRIVTHAFAKIVSKSHRISAVRVGDGNPKQARRKNRR